MDELYGLLCRRTPRHAPFGSRRHDSENRFHQSRHGFVRLGCRRGLRAAQGGGSHSRERPPSETGIRGADRRTGAQDECGVRCGHGCARPGDSMGHDLPAGREDAGHEKGSARANGPATPGRLRVVAADGTLSAPVAGLPPLVSRGQGGLLDVAIDPAFASNQLIYWTFSEPQEDGTESHCGGARQAGGGRRTARGKRAGHLQTVAVPALERTLWKPAGLRARRHAVHHSGDRRIEAGRQLVQQMNSLQGKIVRINPDGSIPKDNPFVGKEGVRPEIWSLGHQNVQAATINPTTGELWEVEHGTRGGDELNIVRKGKELRLAGCRRHRISRGSNPRVSPRRMALNSRCNSWIGHRAERHGVLYRRPFPGMERQPVHRGLPPPTSCGSTSKASASSMKSGCSRTCSRNRSVFVTCARGLTGRCAADRQPAGPDPETRPEEVGG